MDKYNQILRISKVILVGPLEEFDDLTIDLRETFQMFDHTFFGGTLKKCKVKFSNNLYRYAGLCTYNGMNEKYQCTIRLSEPLLKLRTRRDLLETLLHEMIHAYLLIHGDEDEEHGPLFLDQMRRINKMTNVKVTVYHYYIDELDFHHPHRWKCDGPCQFKPPNYGYIKRRTEREPSEKDSFWEAHKRICGGTFIKVSKPVPLEKKVTPFQAEGRRLCSVSSVDEDSNAEEANESPDFNVYKSQETPLEVMASHGDVVHKPYDDILPHPPNVACQEDENKGKDVAVAEQKNEAEGTSNEVARIQGKALRNKFFDCFLINRKTLARAIRRKWRRIIRASLCLLCIPRKAKPKNKIETWILPDAEEVDSEDTTTATLDDGVEKEFEIREDLLPAPTFEDNFKGTGATLGVPANTTEPNVNHNDLVLCCNCPKRIPFKALNEHLAQCLPQNDL
ncbi:unnamed protein product [Bursaphelenchus okinawaensis]|uniref:SprT-like domain-containing protein n=1 Tax=Bursaphelenchus okinawaensis TaxID=465554 RepID=A0A811L7T0_9BILA|nr:unnamed protein product [Bursaphelenchus okinawaensis]CAG9119737.1 unnamed protein product [Bursaphelenchus okinawaensis]